MLPVIPTTSGSNRRRQPAATAPSAAMPSATRITVTSPSAVGSAGGRVTSSAAAPAATASSRWSWPSVRSPGSATKRLPGRTARESTEPPRTCRSERVRSRPPVRRTRSSAVRAGPGSVTPGSLAWTVVTGPRPAPKVRHPVGQQVGRRDRIGGDAPEQLERHHGHLEVADPDDGRRALLDADRDDEVGDALLAADVADERVVEQVDLPGAVAVVRLRVPDLGRPGLAADVVALHQRAVLVERHRRDDVVHQADQLRRQVLVDDLRFGRVDDLPLADRLHDMGLDHRPAVHQRGIGRRELDRRDRHALAERAVGEVDLGPRLEPRVADDAGRFVGEVDARLGPEAKLQPGVIEDRRRRAGRRSEVEGDLGRDDVARVGHAVLEGHPAHARSVGIVDLGVGRRRAGACRCP